MKRKDGTAFFTEHYVLPLENEKGERIGWVSVVRDITEKKRGDEALRESEAKWRSLTENSPDYIMTLDRDGTILFINRTMPDLDRDKVLGTTVYEHVRSEFWPAMRSCFQRVFETGQPDQCEVEYHTVRGGVRCFEARVGPVLREGEVVAITVDSTDVTERKRAEAELRKARDELEERVRERTSELAAINRRLEEEVTERKRLEREVLDASAREQHRLARDLHDGIGQQLIGLRMLAQNLQQGLTARSLAEAEIATEIVQGVQHALNVTHSIIRGTMALGLSDTDLPGALCSLAIEIEDRFGTPCLFRGAESVQCHPEAMKHLYFIAQEAATNAARHARATQIALGLHATGEQVALTVQDDGAGIPDSAASAPGAGLRMMKYRAEVMGGNLIIESIPAGGTLVRCTLPRTAPPKEE
jgi:PAS domain S-box-containing protein